MIFYAAKAADLGEEGEEEGGGRGASKRSLSVWRKLIGWDEKDEIDKTYRT